MPNPARGATEQYVEHPNSNSYEQQNYADFGDPAELLADRSMGGCPGGVCPTRGDSTSGPSDPNLPNLEITGTINPVENQWGDNRDDYTEAIEKSGFSYSNLGNSKKNRSESSDQPQEPEENKDAGAESGDGGKGNDPSTAEGQDDNTSNSENHQEGEPASPSDREPPEGAVEEEEIKDGNTDNNEESQGDTAGGEDGQDGGEPAGDTSSAAAANEANEDNKDAGEGESAGDSSTDSGERTLEQQYQDALRQAAEQGKPVVVVFGSQAAMDTQKQTGETLQANMQDGDAVFMYVDTDTLDPNSDLGQVARRSEEDGRGLGADGKSDANLAFTGIYNVEQRADGSFGLGNSVATFQGGRSEITNIMREQMQYAKRSTLDLRKDNNPDVQPPQPNQPDVDSPTDNRPPGTDNRPGDNRPNPDTRPDQRPENNPDTTDDTDDGRDREDHERTEAERKEAEERARLEQMARDKHFNGSEVQQAMEVAAKTGRPMVMKFGASWCGPCRAMEAGTWNNGNVQNHMKENDVFTKVDVDANPELAQQYGISSVPTTLIGNVTQGADGRYRFNPSERLSGNIGAYDMLNYLAKYRR